MNWVSQVGGGGGGGGGAVFTKSEHIHKAEVCLFFLRGRYEVFTRYGVVIMADSRTVPSPPIHRLSIEKPFHSLSSQEKFYAHYLSRYVSAKN